MNEVYKINDIISCEFLKIQKAILGCEACICVAL